MIFDDYPSYLLSVSQAKRLKKLGYNLKSHFHLEKDKSGRYRKENLIVSYIAIDFNSDKNSLTIPTFEEFQVWFQKRGYLCSISYYNYLHFSKIDSFNHSNTEYLGEVNFYVKISKSVKDMVCKESNRIDIESSYRLNTTYGSKGFRDARNIAVNELINFYLYDNKNK